MGSANTKPLEDSQKVCRPTANSVDANGIHSQLNNFSEGHSWSTFASPIWKAEEDLIDEINRLIMIDWDIFDIGFDMIAKLCSVRLLTAPISETKLFTDKPSESNINRTLFSNSNTQKNPSYMSKAPNAFSASPADGMGGESSADSTRPFSLSRQLRLAALELSISGIRTILDTAAFIASGESRYDRIQRALKAGNSEYALIYDVTNINKSIAADSTSHPIFPVIPTSFTGSSARKGSDSFPSPNPHSQGAAGNFPVVRKPFAMQALQPTGPLGSNPQETYSGVGMASFQIFDGSSLPQDVSTTQLNAPTLFRQYQHLQQPQPSFYHSAHRGSSYNNMLLTNMNAHNSLRTLLTNRSRVSSFASSGMLGDSSHSFAPSSIRQGNFENEFPQLSLTPQLCTNYNDISWACMPSPPPAAQAARSFNRRIPGDASLAGIAPHGFYQQPVSECDSFLRGLSPDAALDQLCCLFAHYNLSRADVVNILMLFFDTSCEVIKATKAKNSNATIQPTNNAGLPTKGKDKSLETSSHLTVSNASTGLITTLGTSCTNSGRKVGGPQRERSESSLSPTDRMVLYAKLDQFVGQLHDHVSNILEFMMRKNCTDVLARSNTADLSLCSSDNTNSEVNERSGASLPQPRRSSNRSASDLNFGMEGNILLPHFRKLLAVNFFNEVNPFEPNEMSLLKVTGRYSTMVLHACVKSSLVNGHYLKDSEGCRSRDASQTLPSGLERSSTDLNGTNYQFFKESVFGPSSVTYPVRTRQIALCGEFLYVYDAAVSSSLLLNASKLQGQMANSQNPWKRKQRPFLEPEQCVPIFVINFNLSDKSMRADSSEAIHLSILSEPDEKETVEIPPADLLNQMNPSNDTGSKLCRYLSGVGETLVLTVSTKTNKPIDGVKPCLNASLSSHRDSHTRSSGNTPFTHSEAGHDAQMDESSSSPKRRDCPSSSGNSTPQCTPANASAFSHKAVTIFVYPIRIAINDSIHYLYFQNASKRAFWYAKINSYCTSTKDKTHLNRLVNAPQNVNAFLRNRFSFPVGPAAFEYIRMLGAGTFGRVLLVRHRYSGRKFAMKIIRKAEFHTIRNVTDVRREKIILEALDCPYIVKMHGCFQTDSRVYLIFDYLAGGELLTHTQKAVDHHFTEPIARFFIAELAIAVEYLRVRGIVHRDIKGDNLVLDDEGHLVLTDFGFAKKIVSSLPSEAGESNTDEQMLPRIMTGGDNRPTSPPNADAAGYWFSPHLFPVIVSSHRNVPRPGGVIVRQHTSCGTLAYMAPEMLENPRKSYSNAPDNNNTNNNNNNTNTNNPDPNARMGGYQLEVDWWSIGVVFFTLLTGYFPFLRSNNRDTIQVITHGKLCFPESPSLSPEAIELVRALLCKNPKKRLSCLADMKQYKFFDGFDWKACEDRTMPPPLLLHRDMYIQISSPAHPANAALAPNKFTKEFAAETRQLHLLEDLYKDNEGLLPCPLESENDILGAIYNGQEECGSDRDDNEEEEQKIVATLLQIQKLRPAFSSKNHHHQHNNNSSSGLIDPRYRFAIDAFNYVPDPFDIQNLQPQTLESVGDHSRLLSIELIGNFSRGAYSTCSSDLPNSPLKSAQAHQMGEARSFTSPSSQYKSVAR